MNEKVAKFKKANYSTRSAPMPSVKKQVDSRDGEWYVTPRWATEALLVNEKFYGTVLEPACGDGAISKVLLSRSYIVQSSDLYDRGYGTTGVDFFSLDGPFDNVVTNPPYSLAGEFVAHAVPRTKGNVALFLRLAFLEGVERYEKIFNNPDLCPNRVYVFPNRVTLYPAGAEKKGGGTTAYAWFVWDNRFGSGTTVRWIDPSLKRNTRE